MPNKDCSCSADDDPCEVFRQVSFPVDDFFPPNASASIGSGCSCSCDSKNSRNC